MRLITATLALLVSVSVAHAQNTTGLVVSACGAVNPVYMAGRPGPPTIDTAGNLCSNAVSNTVEKYNEVAPTLAEGEQRALRADVKGRLIITQEKRATYAAGIVGLVPQAAATDIFCIQGSATKTIIVKHITFAGIATSLGAYDMLVVKRSTANTGGTATNPTNVPMDSTNAAATTTIIAYTANPTTGTLTGIIDTTKFSLPAATGQAYERSRQYGFEENQGIVIRGTDESACLNFNGQTAAGNSLSISVEWREIVE